MIADDALPPPFQEGLRGLREMHCADANVAAVDGNFALVYLGEGPAPDAYDETIVRVYARMPLDIRNAEPYGVVTIPLLRRKDGAAIGHQHAGHPNARPLAAPGEAPPAFWSWNWAGLGRRGPSDLALAYEWAWKCIRDGAR